MRNSFYIFLLSASVLVACKKNNSGPNNNTSGTSHIDIQNMQFSPASTSVTKGNSITWENKDNVSHTVTANDGSFDSGEIKPGTEYSHTFNSTGTFSYHCTYHSSMKGSVVVNQ
jgi:plastocyanin